MRLQPRYAVRWLALALTVVAGCDDTSPTSGGAGGINPCATVALCRSEGRGSGTTTPLPPGDVARFAYAANVADNTLSMFLVDSTTGRLTPMGYVLTGAAPVAVVTDPGSQFLYVANRDDNTVSAFAIDEHTGTLSEISGSPFAAGSAPSALAVDASGAFLFVAEQGAQDVRVYGINATTGALTLRSTRTTGRTSTALAVYETGTATYLYVGNENASGAASITGFLLDDAAGTLNPAPDALSNTRAIGQGTIALTLHPTAAFLYAVTSQNGDVGVFSIDVSTGALTLDNASTASVATGGSAVGISPSGAHAYVTNAVSGIIRDYTVAGSGLFSPIASSADITTGGGPVSVVMDPLGERLYVSSTGTNQISVLAINTTTGVLTASGTTRARQEPRSLALVTRGAKATATARYALILNRNTSTVSSYKVDASSGALTPNGPQPLTSGLGIPRALTVDPFARFAYVAHESNVVSFYRIAATTGALASIDSVTPGAEPTVTLGVDPTAIAVEPSGRYAYAAGSTGTGWQVVVLGIDQLTGALAEVASSSVDTGALPVALAADPTGRFLYVLNNTDATISVFAIDATTGMLTSAGTATLANADPLGLTVDPSGRFMYGVSAAASRIEGFAIDASTGSLASVMAPLTTGTNASPSAVAADPTGRFVYAANTATNNIRPYSINTNTGVLTAGTVSSASGTSPTALAAEPSGKFVYVTNQASNSLATYSINQTTGNLTRVAGASISTGLSAPVGIGLTTLIE